MTCADIQYSFTRSRNTLETPGRVINDSEFHRRSVDVASMMDLDDKQKIRFYPYDFNSHSNFKANMNATKIKTVSNEEELSDDWFTQVTQQLNDCPKFADEEDLLPPSKTALSKSAAVLQMTGNIRSLPDIYTADESGVAIDFRTDDGQGSVLLIIGHDGSGVAFFSAVSTRGRIRCNDAMELIQDEVIALMGKVGIVE